MAIKFVKSSLPVRKLSVCAGLRRFDWPKEKQTTFPSIYNSEEVEHGWYEWWEKNNFFKFVEKENSEKCDKFSIVLPPPNVTGTLHLGHALTVTIQDVLARWYRMKGSEVVWVPGIDHAGIATQVVVEKQLLKERNVTRQEIGREKFLNEVWKWKNEKACIINKQLRQLGASLDWSKECFTMDENHVKAVNKALAQLWDSGLLFREPALVNWSCFLRSAISDIEVDDWEVSGPTDIKVPGYEQPVQFGLLTDFAYKLLNSDEEVIVSTTRLETMMGDVAVAVHPSDTKYTNFHGATLWHPFRHTPIPLVCDESVDMNFATGAVKVTPAHDSKDFEIAKRHSLPIVPVINEDGNLNDFLHSPFSGMRRFDARKAILTELKNQGLFRGQRSHKYNLPVCSRSGDIIEYILKPQWFIECKHMAKKAADAVRSGDLEIYPENHRKVWLSWLDNIKSWNISRQIWWGHQLPLYEVSHVDGKKVPIWVVANSMSEAKKKSAGILKVHSSELIVKQDPDVLDTWFSSGLFPFSVFGWPSETADLNKYYPLNLMVTGHDISFFWVARMVMLGLQLTQELPFKKIFLHGIVCDAHGRKMSKSLGNVVNPEDIIKGVSLKDLNEKISASFESGFITEVEKEKAFDGQKALLPKGIPDCGTDALRFTLASQNVSKDFVNFDVNECIKNRAFCNKIWQAFRFVLGKVSQVECSDDNMASISLKTDKLTLIDRWILSKLSEAVDNMNSSLHNLELHEATAAFKHFFYDAFCDVYLESTKIYFFDNKFSFEAKQASSVLLHCCDVSLRLMSPIMPYLAEELNIWMPKTKYHSIMISEYPTDLKEFRDVSLEEEVDTVLGLITAIRRLKVESNLNKKLTTVEIVSEKKDLLERHDLLMKALLKDELIIHDKLPDRIANNRNIASEAFSYHTHVYIHLEDNAAVSEEKIQVLLNRELKINKSLRKLLDGMNKKGYKEKAPAAVQAFQKEKVQSLQEELIQVRKKLELAGVLSDKRETG